MPMDGFSQEFKNPVHYIVDITERIWEGRGVELIRDWYAAECVLRTPLFVTIGAEPVVSSTYETLEIFPDRELLPEDVVIGEKSSGFYSSHRIMSTATHRGDGAYGKATGRPIKFRTIADCLCRGNQIVEEWLVRDQGAMARQIGVDPAETAAVALTSNRAGAAPGEDALLERWTDANGLTIEGDEELGAWLIDAQRSLWMSADLEAVKSIYARGVRLEAPGGKTLHGWNEAAGFIRGLATAFPGGSWTPHHAVARADNGYPKRVALRWSYAARHRGDGVYGQPTGKPVALLGISHFEIIDGRIKAEWMMLDEVSVFAQIAA